MRYSRCLKSQIKQPIQPGTTDSLESNSPNLFASKPTYRIYRSVSKEGDLVGRAYVGVGVPYGNFPALPFEKSFFAGGSNGLRAWTTRTIGPGDVSSAVLDIDQLGNLQLEANLEYRFKISKLYRGGLFC